MIQVGKRTIGEGQPPFIIAEVGSNWKTLDDCKNSVVLAAKTGADAVKFQAFTSEALYGMNCIDIKTLPLEWLPALKAKADHNGIEFMCSAFSPELVEAVDPFVVIHKNASAELTHLRMLETYRRLGKPVIVSVGSTGTSLRNDIGIALQALGETPSVLLYCVAEYPARTVYVESIAQMRKEWGRLIGFSDHTTDVACIPREAVRQGACVIEKHVNFAEVASPDSPHSLSTDEFRSMVNSIRHPDTWLSTFISPADMIRRHNRRLIATRDIAPGDTLREGVNFGIFRSLKDAPSALSPWAINEVNGRVARNAIMAGDGIAPADVG